MKLQLLVGGLSRVALRVRETSLFYRSASSTSSDVQTQSTSKTRREKLVILGTGWASYSVLKTINKRLYDVIVISPRNHFLFTPLLASTTVGTLEFRSIIEPVRNSGFRQSGHFLLSRAVSLDPAAKTLEIQSTVDPSILSTISYDKLIIGVGALSNTFNIPGVKENAFFLKQVSDARNIRNRLLNNLELAITPGISDAESQRLLHTVIVGGGPTGVEFGAELYDFLQQDVFKLYKEHAKRVNVTLVESNKVLASFDKRLQRFAEKKIQQRDRFHLVKSSVTEVTRDHVKLSSGERIDCGLVVWSTGLAPRDFTQNLDVPKNSHAQILTDRKFQVLGTPPGSVFAIGDCADIDGYALPCTAQVAERQGRYLSKLLNHADPESLPPFTFKSLGMLAYIGNYEALTDLEKLKVQGFPSWILWRSAYLTRLGSWRLRMQVPMDWLKTLIYGRDTSRF